jgi:hypothetical protein
MAKNALNHNYTLSNLHTDAKYARQEKRWISGSKYSRNASRRYNRAVRKASKLQLSRYRAPATDVPDPFWVTEPEWDDGYWADRLAEQVREEYWDDLRFNSYCEEYDEVMQPDY